MPTKHLHFNAPYKDITAHAPGKNGYKKPSQHSSMKIALLTDGIYPFVMGGMQKHSYYLAKYLAKKGVQVDLYHIAEGDVDYSRVFSADELKYINPISFKFPEVSYFPGHYLRESYIYSKLIYEHLVHHLDVDFIYAKGFTAWKLLNQKQRGYKFPPIGVNFHGYEMYQKAPSWNVKLEHYLLRPPVRSMIKKADAVFSYGGKINKIIEDRGLEPNNILEIPSGIEKDWIIPNLKFPKRKRRFVFVGRFERRKGIEEISQTVTDLIEQYDFDFHFIGAIPENVRVKSTRCTYWNAVTDQENVKEILRECDVLVCPSYSEGMPNVILEGMASGLAIIATDVGAVSSMVSDKNGWLITAGSIKELRQAMLSALQLPDNSMISKKKHSILLIKKSYTWDTVIETTLSSIKGFLHK